jgi:hypothetical protein
MALRAPRAASDRFAAVISATSMPGIGPFSDRLAAPDQSFRSKLSNLTVTV